MPNLRDRINALPLIRTLHKIYVVHSACQKIDRDLTALEHQLALDRVTRYELSAATSSSTGVYDGHRDQPLVVSLTSYGERIHSVHLAIESLLLQTVKADKIVLWLAEDEFSYEALPEVLKLQERRGLEIAFTSDTRSYKKLIPALQQYPEALIITVDDDFTYPVNHIERLYKAWQQQPELIHCYRAHGMDYDEQGRLRSYNDWEFDIHRPEAALDIFPTGNAGVLYYPGCFAEDVLEEEKYMALCPTADDIWFKFMTMLNGVSCKVLPMAPEYARITPIPGIGGDCLWDINREENDRQLEQVLSAYAQQLKG